MFQQDKIINKFSTSLFRDNKSIDIKSELFFEDIILEFNSNEELQEAEDLYFSHIKNLFGIEYKIIDKQLHISTKDYFNFLFYERVLRFPIDGYLIFLANLQFNYTCEEELTGPGIFYLNNIKNTDIEEYDKLLYYIRAYHNNFFKKYSKDYLFIDSLLKNDEKTKDFLNIFDYRFIIKEREDNLFSKLLFYSVYLDYKIYFVINNKSEFVICREDNISNYILEGCYILDISSIFNDIFDDNLVEIKGFKQIKKDIKEKYFGQESNSMPDINKILKSKLENSDFYYNGTCIIKIKKGFISYLEMNGQIPTDNVSSLRYNIEDYSEITSIREKGKIVSSKIKEKLKFEK